MRAVQSFAFRSSMGAANRETAEIERPLINNEALAREERRMCGCALAVANLGDRDVTPSTNFIILDMNEDADWVRVPTILQARQHANSCRPLCRTDGMAVTRGIFNLLLETALTPRGQDWLETETVELSVENGQHYARLEIVERDFVGQRHAHPTIVFALLTTKSGARWRVDMRPTLQYHDRFVREIPHITYPEEAGARREAKQVMRDLLAPFGESDDARVELTVTALWRVDRTARVGSQWLGQLRLRTPPMMIFGGSFLLRLFWSPDA